MKKIIVFILLLLVFNFLNSCVSKQPVKKTGELLSKEEAMQIVAEHVMKSAYLQDYYVIGSENYDPRVESISWGEPILIDVIADGRKYTKNTKYYLLTGVLPDGQIMAAQTINAYTGSLMDGAYFIDEDSDKLLIAEKDDFVDYANSRGLTVFDIEPVFYCDGTIQTQNTVFSWRYHLIGDKTGRALDGNLSGENYFIDPWVNLSKNTSDLRNDNGFFSRVNYNHRLFKLVKDNGERSVNGEPEGKFIPLD